MASSNPVESAQEARQLLVAYAKQETIDPLKDLGRYLAWGLSGAVFVFLGVLFLSLGLLRGLQRIDALDGGYRSLAPYGITLVALLVAAGLVAVLFQRAKDRVR